MNYGLCNEKVVKFPTLMGWLWLKINSFVIKRIPKLKLRNVDVFISIFPVPTYHAKDRYIYFVVNHRSSCNMYKIHMTNKIV